ncbi:deaminase [Arachnia rubra]|uniref:MafB19-like deaminase domain-containing protein n=1 Tax=Arachnia rubra TaxID=1547448 RepID=A0ABX7Y9S4_9ACTN|nr:deaminase [Arachnia rubra]QUC09709.1 hypothetical protein J5A65_11875 [Arachnia rubra]
MAGYGQGEVHTLYITHESCVTCARLIVNSRRVRRVVYVVSYTEPVRQASGLPSGEQILAAAGLAVEQWSDA